jgi:predicted ATPase
VISNCVALGIEGTCGSGKTTLCSALAARYRELGIRVTVVDDQARRSPFVAEIMAGGRPGPDVETAADLFAAQLSAQLRAARNSDMIICDTTTATVLGIARLVLPAPARSRAAAALAAMEAFGRVMAPACDAVFYCCDWFGCEPAGDPWRARLHDLRAAADRVIRSACATAGQRVIDLPPNMTTSHRVAWIAARAAKLKTIAPPI